MNDIHMRRFRNIPPLQYLLGFEAASRLESFSKAAEELGLSQSAVSHEMRLLEERLGQPLFIRHGRSVRLTDAGRDYQRTVALALEKLDAGYRRLEPYRKPGSVVVYCPTDFAGRWMIPRLSDLKQSVPNCDPWIDTSDTKIDFDEMEISIAIVRAREVDSALESHCLFADVLIPVVSPSLFRRPLQRAVDILKYPLIHDERPEGWDDWFENAGVKVTEVSAGLDFSDSEMALRAAEEAYGISLACRPLVADSLARKKLVIACSHSLATGQSWFMVSTIKELSESTTLGVWNWLKSTNDG
jgi:LysR family transcriptional regulator, glycine cleavage system transcriptional activator